MGILNNVAVHYNRADYHLIMGNFEKAIKYLDKALEIDPNYVMAWVNKGFAFGNIGKFDEALKCCNRALKIKPDFSLALLNKAIILAELNDYEEIVNCYDDLLKMDKKILKKGIKDSSFKYPNVIVDIWNSKGLALFNLGKYREAVLCYNNALKIDSNNEIVLINKKLAENELNNMGSVTCPDCKTENPEDAEFCQGCGKKLESINEDNIFNSTNENLFCPNCNTLINSEVKFCTICGYKIEKEFLEKVCPKCNFKIRDKANFCPECGENLKIKKEISLIDINNDSEEKIASISGIGPILAKKAVKIRESKGGFSSVDDFCVSLGLKPHVVSRVEDYIICNPLKSEKHKFSGRVVDW